MRYAYLGRTGLQVSRLGLGTMNFGMVTDEATSFEIMDEALKQGVIHFDTADVFERQMRDVAVDEAIAQIKERGYLRSKQPPVGMLHLLWQYVPAQSGAPTLKGDMSYPLFIWQQPHGVFLSLS